MEHREEVEMKEVEEEEDDQSLEKGMCCADPDLARISNSCTRTEELTMNFGE